MTPETTEPRGRGIARISRIVLLSGMVLGLGLWAAGWMRDSLLYVHETDARIVADMVSVSSRVAGRVTARPLRGGSLVGRGDTLAVIDGRVSQTRLDELLAELGRILAEGAARGAEIALLDRSSEAARREIDLIARQRETLEFRKAEVRARIERQRIDLADRVVVSPLDGVVSRVFVEVGEYVQPGQRIALVHDPRNIYVEANIRETDIRRLFLDQAVRVEVDAYPDLSFEGRIEMIGAAATSEFALLPNPNPSGNFTKVTQRLPVRISIDQLDGLLRPGMMVEVFIRIEEDAGGLGG